MEFNRNYKCKFIQNLSATITKVYMDIVDHEVSMIKCVDCLENKSDVSFIKNQLLPILRVNISIKAEIKDAAENTKIPGCEEKLPDNLEDEIIKEEQEKEPDVSEDDGESDLSAHTSEGNEMQEDSQLERKKRRKSKTGKKICPFCCKPYKFKHDCKKVESTVNKFTCSYCPEVFKTYPKIYKHHKAKHKDKPQPLSPFQCEICGTFALRMYELTRHMRIHMNYFPFTCDFPDCEKKCRTKQKLAEHQRKHIPKSQQDDKYKCDVCDKRFTFPQSLKKHKHNQHTADERRRFPCNICGGRFITETSLQKHQATHREDAPRRHKCDNCGRLFDQLKYLNHHRKKQHSIYTDLMLNPRLKKKKE
ncbi:Zinc finger C2H2 superfamily [Sergentomyia squamirostris]